MQCGCFARVKAATLRRKMCVPTCKAGRWQPQDTPFLLESVTMQQIEARQYM